ncbi:MAG: NADPH:quinone oxidoreductase family protein [Gemmatimonadota bacterium]
MNAIVCERFAPLDALVWKELPDANPGPGEVAIRIRAAGLNFADALLVQGLYQVRPPCPFVPGSELAGEIVSVGDDVSGFEIGDRVMAFSTTMGAFAERGVFRAGDVMPVPDGVGFEEAAALLCAHGTAHHALKQRARLQPGETLLVLGASGGTGSAAVQIGKAMGATVMAACSTSDKLELARENGADILIDYTRDDLRATVKERTDGKGVDVVYDPVGGDAFDASTRCLARNGRLLVIGFASGRIPSIPVNLALVKEYAVVGVFWGNFVRAEPQVFAENMRELVHWHSDASIRVPIEDRLPLERTAEGLARLVNRQAKGKIVVTSGQT